MKMWGKRGHILSIVGIVLCLSVMMVFNHMSYYYSIMAKMKNMGMGTIRETAEKIENYLSNDIEIVQTTAYSLEYMMEKNVSEEEIEE